MTSIPLLIRGIDFCDCLASNLGWVIQVDNDVDDLVVDVCFLVIVVTPVFIEEIENYTVRYSPRFKNDYSAEMWSGSEERSYVRRIDFCIT